MADRAHNKVEWLEDLSQQIDYPASVAFMEQRVAAIHDGAAPEIIRLLEHPPLYSAGTSAKVADLLDPDRFPARHSPYVGLAGWKFRYPRLPRFRMPAG